MKRAAMLSLLAMMTGLLLVGCGSRYVLVTEDYSVYITKTKPEHNPSGDTLTFEDESGKEVTIPRSSLKQTRELHD